MACLGFETMWWGEVGAGAVPGVSVGHRQQGESAYNAGGQRHLLCVEGSFNCVLEHQSILDKLGRKES